MTLSVGEWYLDREGFALVQLLPVIQESAVRNIDRLSRENRYSVFNGWLTDGRVE